MFGAASVRVIAHVFAFLVPELASGDLVFKFRLECCHVVKRAQVSRISGRLRQQQSAYGVDDYLRSVARSNPWPLVMICCEAG